MTNFKEGFPVRFSSPEDLCDTYDEREYCQMVQPEDNINFAWDVDVLSDNVIECSEFENDTCNIANWTGWSYGDNQRCVGSPGTLATPSDTLTQTNVFTNGTWKITLIIPGFPLPDTSYDYAGTFQVKAGDTLSAVTTVAAGTYVFYLTVTSGTDLIIIPDDAIICLSSITAVKICEDYQINIYDLSNSLAASTTNGITRIDGTMIFKGLWSDFELEPGCYTLCVVSLCNGTGCGLVSNGAFFDNSAWVAESGWLISGGTATFGDSVSTESMTQVILLAPYEIYILTVDYSVIGVFAQCEVFIGGVSGGFLVEGTNTIIVKTGATPTTIEFIGYGSENQNSFEIDNVGLYTANYSCSQCYNLKSDHGCTKLLSWTNDDDAFGIPYSSIVFTNYLRVIAFIEKPRYPEESDRFTYSDGQRKILYATSEKIWTLKFGDLPQYLHDAIALAKIHDHFYVDGVEYICVAGNYEPEWRGRNKAAQSKIEIQKVVDNKKNKNC